MTSAVEQTFASVNTAVTHAYRVRARVATSSAAGAVEATSAATVIEEGVELCEPVAGISATDAAEAARRR